MVMPEDLAYLPGAPFSPEEVAAAEEAVQGAALWHIAPQATETVTLDVARGERWLRLPTRRLVSVSEIRNADTGAVIDPSLYRVSLAKAQVARRSGCWPEGFAAVEVDMVHGYESIPPDLLPVIAEAANVARREQRLAAVRIDDFQQSFTAAVSDALGTSETLARYSLRGNPLYGLGIA